MKSLATNPSTGLVLSGGGVKGVAHIGVIKALNEHDIYPQYISGVSAGALVGALYANNYTPEEMLAFFKETPLFKYNFLTINKPGLFDTEKYRQALERHFPENRFEALHRPLYVTATDLEEGKPVYFQTGELIHPLLASAALPPVFSPVNIKGTLYSDGGIMNNFPVEPLRNQVDYLIGSYTSNMGHAAKNELSSSLQISQRATLLMLHTSAMNKLHLPDLLFRPEGLGLIGILDKKAIDKAFELGYEHACRVLDSVTCDGVRVTRDFG